MELQVEKGDIILSAAYIYNNKLSSSLLINTLDKGVFPLYTESSENYIKYVFCEDDQAFVKLISQNQEDRDILSRIEFSNHSKDQIHILFLDKESYRRIPDNKEIIHNRQLIKDCLNGERAVKDKAVEYLAQNFWYIYTVIQKIIESK